MTGLRPIRSETRPHTGARSSCATENGSDRADAETLGIDSSRIIYTQLADLDTATDKAHQDAPFRCGLPDVDEPDP